MNKRLSIILITFLAIALFGSDAFAQIREGSILGNTNYLPGGDLEGNTKVFIFGTAVIDVTGTDIAAFPTVNGTNTIPMSIAGYKSVSIQIMGASQQSIADGDGLGYNSSSYINNVTAAAGKDLEFRVSSVIRNASVWNEKVSGDAASNSGIWANVILPLQTVNKTQGWQVGGSIYANQVGVATTNLTYPQITARTIWQVTECGMYRADVAGMRWLTVSQPNAASADVTTVIVITRVE